MTYRLEAKLRGYIHGVFPTKLSELENDVPYVSAADGQELTDGQQRAALENVNATEILAENFVRHDVATELSEEAQQTARDNIGTYGKAEIDERIWNIEVDFLDDANKYADKKVGELAERTAAGIQRINEEIGDEEYQGFDTPPTSIKNAINELAKRKPDGETIVEAEDVISAVAIKDETSDGEKTITPQTIVDLEKATIKIAEDVDRLKGRGGYLTPYNFEWDGVSDSVQVGDTFNESRNGVKTEITVVADGSGNYPAGTNINLTDAYKKAVDWQIDLMDWATFDIWGAVNRKYGTEGLDKVAEGQRITLSVKSVTAQTEPFCEIFGTDADGNSYGAYQQDGKFYFGSFAYDAEAQTVTAVESDEIWDGVSALKPFRKDYSAPKGIVLNASIERPFGGDSGLSWEENLIVWGKDFYEIFNGTRVINEFNNWEMELTNTQDTEPPVCSWATASIDQEINYADDDTGGIVRTGQTTGEGASRVYGVQLDDITKQMYVSELGEDLAEITQNVEDKVEKIASAVENNIAVFDSNGGIKDNGIKASDFATAAQGALADSAYQKPLSGIPNTDLAQGVQDSLGLADSALQGITAGNNITIDTSDPKHPVISSTGGGGIGEIEPLTIQLNGTGGVVFDGSEAQSLNITAAGVGAEPTIATKRTAFNKDFGTAAGTVMEGNDSRVTGAVQSVTFAGTELTKTEGAAEITQSDARTALGLGSAAYTASTVYATSAQGALADSAYQKPSTGIPATDLAEGVQDSLALANSALQSVPDATATQKGVATLGASGGAARYGQKNDVGLGNVANVLQYSTENPPPYPVTSVAGKTGAVTLVKADVGLGNVDNTADLDKPVSTATQTALNAKIGNTGAQSIAGNLTLVADSSGNGNLVVQGDLTVQGTTITEEHETLNVVDNLIVTNSEGASLTDLSGVAIRKNATDTYGVLYDPVSDSVKLGLGTIDAEGDFAFNPGEGKPVTIRDDSANLTDGHLLEWDGTENKVVDGGAKPEANPTDSATQDIEKIKINGTTYSIPKGVNVVDIGTVTLTDSDGVYINSNVTLTTEQAQALSADIPPVLRFTVAGTGDKDGEHELSRVRIINGEGGAQQCLYSAILQTEQDNPVTAQAMVSGTSAVIMIVENDFVDVTANPSNISTPPSKITSIGINSTKYALPSTIIDLGTVSFGYAEEVDVETTISQDAANLLTATENPAVKITTSEGFSFIAHKIAEVATGTGFECRTLLERNISWLINIFVNGTQMQVSTKQVDGSFVAANPSTEATATLTKLTVQGGADNARITYEIPQGAKVVDGGTINWNGEEGESQQTITAEKANELLEDGVIGATFAIGDNAPDVLFTRDFCMTGSSEGNGAQYSAIFDGDAGEPIRMMFTVAPNATSFTLYSYFLRQETAPVVNLGTVTLTQSGNDETVRTGTVSITSEQLSQMTGNVPAVVKFTISGGDNLQISLSQRVGYASLSSAAVYIGAVQDGINTITSYLVTVSGSSATIQEGTLYTVTPNSGTGGTPLTSLRIGTSTYSIPQGSEIVDLGALTFSESMGGAQAPGTITQEQYNTLSASGTSPIIKFTDGTTEVLCQRTGSIENDGVTWYTYAANTNMALPAQITSYSVTVFAMGSLYGITAYRATINPSEGGDNGIPTGGLAGQALTKQSGADYDVAWTSINTSEPTVITEAAYAEALAAGTIENDKLYYIQGTSDDTLNVSQTAEGTSYSNTSSGLTATNVQDAIDELKENEFSGSYNDLMDKPTLDVASIATALGLTTAQLNNLVTFAKSITSANTSGTTVNNEFTAQSFDTTA